MRVTQLHPDTKQSDSSFDFLCTFVLRQENVFLLLQFLNSSSFMLHYCVHIPLQSAIHQEWHEPAHCQGKRRVLFQTVRVNDQSAEGVRQVLQQNRAHKAVWDYTIIDWFSDDFWSFADEFSVSTSLWRGSPLVVCVGALSMPTCWFSASCWVNEDWLTLHLAHCSLTGGLGLESFLLAAPDAAARSKASLLGCCRPSVCPPVLRKAVTSAVQLCGMCERTMYRVTTWGLKTYKFEFSGNERTNLFGWRPQADI